MCEKRPLIGLAVVVRKDGKILLGQRKNAHGSGNWAFPGGHLEFGESLEECAQREVAEETGMYVKNIHFATLTNDYFEEEGKHYVTLFMVCDWDEIEPQLMEPDKCERWDWFEWGDLPGQIFLPIENVLKKGFDPFDV